MTTTYTVTTADGHSDCGHKHRSLRTADACHTRLAGSGSDGWWSAEWHRSGIVRIDPDGATRWYSPEAVGVGTWYEDGWEVTE